MTMNGFSLSYIAFSQTEIIILFVTAVLFLLGCLFNITVMMRCPHYAKLVRKGKVWFSAARPAVSVVLYTEDNIEALKVSLPAILEQDYKSFEVIIVNDGASETIKDYIKSLAPVYGNLYYTFIPVGAHSLSRKKLAITIGMKAAKYDIVAVTEAGCRPVSDKWLETMMRNFTTDIEIVIGNTKEISDIRAKWYLDFYRLVFKMKFLGRAVINRAYMGEGSNMFFFKDLFFKTKGFSEHLDIVYGEDDVFINRVMTRRNTRAEFSPEALVENYCENNNSSISEMRLRREFTQKLLKGASSLVLGCRKTVSWGFYISVVTSMVYGVVRGNAVLSLFALLLVVLWWLIESAVFRSNARVLGSPAKCSAAILYDIVSPVIDCRFRHMGRKTLIKNYTWRIKR